MPTEQQAKLTLNRINTVMNFQEGELGEKVRWFFCFGTMLEYLADRTFKLNYDIDIGVFYGETDPDRLIKGFEGFGYKVKDMMLHDVDKKPLNIHFKPVNADEASPHIDVFFWLPHKKLYLHTYDVNREGREIPKKYIFKGVKKEWIAPSSTDVELYRNSGIETKQVLDQYGIWHYDIFGDHSEFKMTIPFKYGTLLDEWYPGWRFREHYKGQSKSQWIIEVKSCREL